MLAFLRTERNWRKSSGFKTALLAPLTLLLLGTVTCSAPPKEDAPPPVVASANGPPSNDPVPEETLYQQLRSGSFQLSAAAKSIEDAYKAAKEAAGKLSRNSDAKSAMEDVLDYLDSAGSEVAEISEVPPAQEEVAKSFAAYDERRLKAIESANDSLQDLREALGILEFLSDDPSPAVANAAISVKSLLAVALDDIWGAIEALGGEPVASDEPLNP